MGLDSNLILLLSGVVQRIGWMNVLFSRNCYAVVGLSAQEVPPCIMQTDIGSLEMSSWKVSFSVVSSNEGPLVLAASEVTIFYALLMLKEDTYTQSN
ncbi:hypothetical protein AVEN_16835-1 [Araneus ventricosus]|uniref:Uncharacterized protein n=1 Tax=Araneus ventricosus TaxID=182803 RepID=A0A4Y2BQ27_ARAVE|nr:hypothetical protein AVEN_16835-1 [Araneus ventricosus]